MSNADERPQEGSDTCERRESKPLTERQKEIVQFIRESIQNHQRPPSFREIMDRFGMKSTHAVTGHLTALVKRGAIDWDRASSRCIKLRGVKVVLIEVQP